MTQQTLMQAIGYLYPTAMPNVNYSVSMDASGNASIRLWDNSLGTQPTSDALSVAMSAGQLSSARIYQQAVILTAYKQARWGTPVSLTVGSNVCIFPADAETQLNVSYYIAANILQQAATTTYPLLDVNEAVQMLTYAQLVALAQVIQAATLAAFSKKSALFAQIASATTIAAVQAVDW